MKGNLKIVLFFLRLCGGAAIGLALSLLMFYCFPQLLGMQEYVEIVNIGFWTFFASSGCLGKRFAGLHCVFCLVSAVFAVMDFHYGLTGASLAKMLRLDLLIVGIALLRVLIGRLSTYYWLSRFEEKEKKIKGFAPNMLSGRKYTRKARAAARPDRESLDKEIEEKFGKDWKERFKKEKEIEEKNEQEYQNALALCSFAEKKKSEGNNNDAFLTYVLAGEGFLNCLKGKMLRAEKPLVEVYRQMEQIALENRGEPGHKKECRFLQLLETAIETLEPLESCNQRVLGSLRVVTLSFAVRSAFRLGDWNRMEQFGEEAHELIGRLKKSGRLTCWVTCSELLLSKAMFERDMDKLAAADMWGKRAYRALRMAEGSCEERERPYYFRQKKRCCKFMIDIERRRRKPLQRLKWCALHVKAKAEERLWLLLYSTTKRILRAYSEDRY